MQRGLSVLPRFPAVPAFTRFCMKKKMSTSPSPLIRKFVSLEGGDIYSRSQPDGFRFRLVSYNILAQVYVKSSVFPHSPKPCIRWKARSQAVLTVLKNLRADFLCLQEVDEYEEFYRTDMEKDGYAGIYIQRNGQKRDGCGIFYKQDRAELILQERIEYNDLVDAIQESLHASDNHDEGPSNGKEDAETKPVSPVKKATKDRGDPNDPRVRLKRDCVGIMAAFRLKDSSGRLIVVANTHLYWDPEWADVKLAQAKYLLLRLDQFRTTVSDNFDCVPPAIVAGDFNSVPGDQVYKYLVSGDTSSFVPERSDELPIPLQSVYGSTRGEPPFTNCTPTFTNTIDYIFFSPSSYLRPTGFLELPNSDSPDVVGGLPNNSHPSDHLPIGAEFEIIP